jgi:uncharacterized membrane protein YhfC
MTPSGIETVTFRFVAQYLNHPFHIYMFTLNNFKKRIQQSKLLLGNSAFKGQLHIEFSFK